MKHKLSKITTLTLLLISGTVNAQNFYTCVPEDDWFKKNFELNISKTRLKYARNFIDNDNFWNLIEENGVSGILEQGIYRVIIKAGDGGKGGNVIMPEGTGTGCGHSTTWGGRGGFGEIKLKVFELNSSAEYKAKIGKKGDSAKDITSDDACAENGSKGEYSSFKIKNIIDMVAYPGKGGGGSYNIHNWCGYDGYPSCDVCIPFGEKGEDGDNVIIYTVNKKDFDSNKYAYGNDKIKIQDGYVKIYKYKG